MTRKDPDTDLNDAEWALLAPIITRPGTMGRPTTLDLQMIVNAWFYWERTGCQWRMLPADFPHWTSVRYSFDKWTNDGTWLRINDTIRRQVYTQAGRGPEPTAGVVDSQRVKTTEAGGERGYDAGKKGKGRKRTHWLISMVWCCEYSSIWRISKIVKAWSGFLPISVRRFLI